MRSLTPPMAAMLATKEAVEPITIIKIKWTTAGDRYYGDKDIGTLVKGCILSVNEFDIVKQSDNYGTVGSLNITLDDSDQEFWTLMNTEELENKEVIVYQSFEGLAPEDWLVLLTGNIVASIEWSEGEQKLTFGVYSNYTKGEDIVGMLVPDFEEFSTLALFPNEATQQDKTSIGRALPLVFGNVVCSETLRINTPKKSTTIGIFTAADGIGESTEWFKVEKGFEFPNSTIDVLVGGVKMRGSFASDKFYVHDYNIPDDLAPVAEILPRVPGDVDYKNYNVAWINNTSPTIDIVNKWVYFYNPIVGNVINYCESREGTKYFFTDSFVKEKPDYVEDSEIGPYLFFADHNLAILQCAPYLNKGWPYEIALDEGNHILSLWSVLPGSEFIVINEPDVYCTNYEPMTNIKAVYAYRNVQQVTRFDNGIIVNAGKTRQLVPVPSHFYKNRQAYAFNGRYVSTLEFDPPLSMRKDEEWEDKVWVVQSSPLSSNTSAVIQYILENFTQVEIDTTSFNAVATLLFDYPSSFGVYDSKKPLDFAREVAWRARCALVIENNIAYLKYLSKEPDSVRTIDTSKILFKSLTVGYSDTESMFTRIKGTFPTNDALETREDVHHYANLRGMFYRGDVAKYGFKQTTWDFYIYNLRDYAVKSLSFWGDRYSKSWKKIKCTCFLGQLDLQLFDCVTLSFPTTYPIGITSCKAIVDSWKYNSDNGTIDLTFLLPILAGTSIVSPLFWVDDSIDGITYFDPSLYYHQVDYNIITYVNKTNNTSKATQEYGIVTASTEEIIEGVPTGNTIYEVKLHDQGFENGGSE